MARTEAQKAADEALRQAVWGVIQAMTPADREEPAEAAGVLTKFMVLAVQVTFDDNGRAQDSLNILYSDGTMLGYEAEGLLAQADRVFATGNYSRNAGYQEE